MSPDPKSRKRRPAKSPATPGIDWSEDWRPVLRATGLVAIVLGTLALGAILAVDERDETIATAFPERDALDEELATVELPHAVELDTQPIPDSIATEAPGQRVAVQPEPEPVTRPVAEIEPRRDPEPAAPSRPSRVIAEAPQHARQAAPPQTPPSATPAAGGSGSAVRVSERAASDLDRLGSAPEGWTLQLVYACDAANVERVIATAGARAELHILPHDACYRVLWGRYRSRLDAEEGGSDVPADLRAQVGDAALPKELGALVR